MDKPEFLIVLGDIYVSDSELDAFVAENLMAMGIEPRFANSTAEFVAMDGYSASHVLVIGSEWNLLLRHDFENPSGRPSFLFIQVSGDTLWDSRKFTIRRLAEDGPLFQRHVRAWLNDPEP